MISGRLERLFSGEYIEGWAVDSLAPERPLAIHVRARDGKIVAEGLANLYREDLAKAACGLGWCGFRLLVAPPTGDLMRGLLTLHDKTSGIRIDFAVELPFVADNGLANKNSQNGADFDPFVILRISQLRACDDLFARFVRSRGAAAFVRTAYVYMLGRQADPEALALHAEMLSTGMLAPFRLLEMIADSKEFSARPRTLAAPNAPGFPFVEATNVG